MPIDPGIVDRAHPGARRLTAGGDAIAWQAVVGAADTRVVYGGVKSRPMAQAISKATARIARASCSGRHVLDG
jgi:ribosomal protein S5